jgi:transcriptional regulator with XRE-family HTH domain
MHDLEEIRTQWAREVGQRIKRAREARGMTQDQIAQILSGDLLGTGPPKKARVSHWERGKREVSAWDLLLLSRILGVSLDHLLGHLAVGASLPALPRQDRASVFVRTLREAEKSRRRARKP